MENWNRTEVVDEQLVPGNGNIYIVGLEIPKRPSGFLVSLSSTGLQ